MSGEIIGKKIVVTGGAGFIGSRLARRLSLANDVVVIDNLHSGTVENLRGVPVKFVHLDSKDIAELDFRPNIVFHLGMYSASAYYKEDHFRMAEVVRESIAVFRFALKNKSKVVSTSTSSIYHSLPPPHKEDQVPYVAGLYTEGRIAMERLAQFYHRQHGLDVTALRLFCVYGMGGEVKGRYANIVNRLALAATGNDSPVLYGDGSAMRDFIDVEDVVEAFVRAGVAEASGVFNVGTGVAYSLRDVKNKIEDIIEKPFEVPYAPAPPTFPPITRADTTKARKKLGFKAKVAFDEGLERLLDYYRVRERYQQQTAFSSPVGREIRNA